MPIPTCPTPSLDEYRQHCLGFFEQRGLDAPTLQELIVPMTVEEFQVWHEKTALAYYDALYPVVRDIAHRTPLGSMQGQAEAAGYRAVLNGVLSSMLEELPCVAKKRQEATGLWQRACAERSRSIHVEGNTHACLGTCTVLHQGSDHDAQAWVVQGAFEAMLVVGDGQNNRYAERHYLERKIDEYRQGIADCEALLALLAV